MSRYQKKHSPTTIIVVINHPYLLSPSTTTHGILCIQSTCSTVFFHNLPLGLVPSTLYSIHFFTQLLSSFRSTCPYHYHRNLFRCSTEIMSSNSSLPPMFKDLFLLVSNGTNCLNLFYPIRILASTAASTSLSTLSMSPK